MTEGAQVKRNLSAEVVEEARALRHIRATSPAGAVEDYRTAAAMLPPSTVITAAVVLSARARARKA